MRKLPRSRGSARASTAGRWSPPARSCAGYLVDSAGLRLLIDCGSGITRRLAERGDEWRTITHVALTHFHIDHHGDLPTLIFAWKYGFLPPRTAPLEIIGPVGTHALLDRLVHNAYKIKLKGESRRKSRAPVSPVEEG